MKIGFVMCGSFCTFEKAFAQLSELTAEHTVIPIMSFNAFTMNTRFGAAASHIAQLEHLCGRSVIATIEDAEPIGPKGMCDLLVVAPCTGNTLAKMAHGICDTPATMAVKSHMRSGGRVLVALSTNDALSSAAENIGRLLSRRGYFFVPLLQDDISAKPYSMVADYSLLIPAIAAAARGEQLRPLVI